MVTCPHDMFQRMYWSRSQRVGLAGGLVSARLRRQSAYVHRRTAALRHTHSPRGAPRTLAWRLLRPGGSTVIRCSLTTVRPTSKPPMFVCRPDTVNPTAMGWAANLIPQLLTCIAAWRRRRLGAVVLARASAFDVVSNAE